MKTKIETQAEFTATIEQYGRALDEIERYKAETKVLKEMIEVYAKAKNIKKQPTENYVLKMKADEPSLKRSVGVSEANVVALLRKDATMKDFITESYNGAAVKSHILTLEDPDEKLASLGLYLTHTVPHAEVKPINR